MWYEESIDSTLELTHPNQTQVSGSMSCDKTRLFPCLAIRQDDWYGG